MNELLKILIKDFIDLGILLLTVQFIIFNCLCVVEGFTVYCEIFDFYFI